MAALQIMGRAGPSEFFLSQFLNSWFHQLFFQPPPPFLCCFQIRQHLPLNSCLHGLSSTGEGKGLSPSSPHTHTLVGTSYFSLISLSIPFINPTEHARVSLEKAWLLRAQAPSLGPEGSQKAAPLTWSGYSSSWPVPASPQSCSLFLPHPSYLLCLHPPSLYSCCCLTGCFWDE